MFKVNDRKTRTTGEICSKLTIKTLERPHEICSKLIIKTPEQPKWGRSGVFIVSFEYISHLLLVFLLLTLSK